MWFMLQWTVLILPHYIEFYFPFLPLAGKFLKVRKETVPNSLNTKEGMTAWVTVSYGFRGSH